MDEKTLICSLIQDDLLNQKLINNLRDMGIDAQDYQLHLGGTIFKLMGIDRPVDDTTFDSYMLFSEIAKYFPVREQGEFRRYAEEIYEYLDTLREPTSKLSTMQMGKLHRLVKDLIKIDLTNFRNYKRLEKLGLDHYGSLFPFMEIIFDFLDLEDRPGEDVDIMSEAYFNKSLDILNVPVKPDYECDWLVDELFELLLCYKESYDRTGRLPDTT